VREFAPVGKPDEGMRLRRASQDGGDEKPAMALLVCREGWMERSVAKHKSNSAWQTGISPKNDSAQTEMAAQQPAATAATLATDFRFTIEL